MDAYIELQSFILNDFLSSYYSKIPLLSKEETIRKLLRDHFISNDCIMQQLWECLRLQNKHDIARFIVSNLPKLPIGCRTHMAFELINFYVIWINSPKQSESNKLIVSSKFTSSLISSWKQSKLTPTDLYMEISSALTKGIVDLNEAENLLNWILLQGAHTPNFSWKMFESTKRCTFSTNCFDTVSIQRAYLSLDGHSCELLSFNKARLILSRDHTMKQQNLKSHQLPISLESPTTGNNLWWSRSTSSVQLSILLPTDTTNRPILLIGESLHYKFGILNIHNIICVDTIDNCCDDFNTIPFAILVQGNFMTNVQGLDVSSRGKSDGRSQCGDSRNESDNDAISDSDDEHLSRKKMPPATSQFRRRYYIIFGIVHVFSQNINVERVMSIQEDIFLDQHPTNLLYQEKNIAIIYGTNALLGMINLNYPPSKSCIEKMLLDENSKKEQALSTDEALNNCPQFQMLTNDTELPLSLNAVLSHANDAMITAIEYKPSSAILCSGDDHGVLCLWRLNFTSKLSSSPSESKSLSNQPLLTLPIRLGTRIYSLALSSTGHLIAVGLWNQLLLITYSENILYVKASLDIVPGFRALYLCHFGQSNTLTIWRIMNSSSKGDYATNSNYTHNRLGLSITTWLHHNLQEFDSGLDALIQSDELVSNNVDNPIVLQNLGYLPSKAEIISQPARELILPQLTSLTDLIKIKMFRQQNLAFLPQQENLSDRAISDVRSRAWSAQSDCFSVYSNASTVFQENDIQGIQNDVISVEDFMEPKADLSIDILNVSFRRELISRFSHGSNVLYKHKISLILAIVLAAQQAPSLELISTSLDLELSTIRELLNQYLHGILDVTTTNDNTQAVIILEDKKMVLNYLVQPNGDEFAIDIAIGHNYLCALYLKYCGNKSVAIEHPWQEYLRSFGCFHLRKSSRMLRRLTRQIRKIDETANIRGTIPRQLGYVVGLQEIYARRVGLYGKLPSELGELLQLRVLSMGNNQLSGELPESFMNLTHLQRIVLHQNKLTGIIPSCKFPQYMFIWDY